MDNKENKPTPEFETMTKSNTWHDRTEIQALVDEILKLSKGDDYSWMWIRNARCKYIDIRIDMRDGGFVLRDKDNERISLDQLKWQFGIGEADAD